MSLGKRLKREREKRNWSQMYVAGKVGITNTVLSNYERDYRDPDTDTLTKLADLYEVAVDYLLGRTEKEIGLKEKDMSSLKDPQTNLMFDGWLEMSEEQRQEALDFMEFLRSKKDKKEK